MVGSILRSWTGRILIIIVLGSVGYSLLKIQSGPRAIRPVAGQVMDPILLPVIENYADEVDANRGDPKIRWAGVGSRWCSCWRDYSPPHRYCTVAPSFPMPRFAMLS